MSATIDHLTHPLMSPAETHAGLPVAPLWRASARATPRPRRSSLLISALLFLVSCWNEPDQPAPSGDNEPVPDEQRVVVGGLPAISDQTARWAHTEPAIVPIPSECRDSGAEMFAPPFRGPRFRPDTAYEYAIELSGTGEVNFAGILQAAGELTSKQAMTSSVDGVTRWTFALQSTARFEVIQSDSPLRFGGRLIDPRLELRVVSGGLPEAVVDKDQVQQVANVLAAQLSAPFEIQAAADGSFEWLHTSPALSRPMMSILTTVLQEFDLPLPAADTLPHAWDSREAETSGGYHYCYIAGASTPGTLQIDKVRMDDVGMRLYDSTSGMPRNEASTSGRARGSRSLALDARGGFLASSRIHEWLDLARPDTRTSATLQLAGEIRLMSVSGADAGGTSSPRVEKSARAMQFGHVIAGAVGDSVEDKRAEVDVTEPVLARLSAISGQGLESFERFRLLHDLSTLIHRGRLPVDKIERAIHDGALPDHRLPLLLAALAHAGGPDLVPIFRSVLEDEHVTDQARLEAILALMHAQAPDPAVVGLLRSVMQRLSPDTAMTAMSVIGILAHRLADSSPDAADQAVSFLEAQVDAESSWQRRAVLLAALGNAGAARSRSTLLHYLEAGREAEQGAAAYALRFSADETAQSALAHHLQHAGYESVRVAAAEALAFRHTPEALEQLAATLASHPPENVRIAVQAQLAGWYQLDKAQRAPQRPAPGASLLTASAGQTLQGDYEENIGGWLAGAAVEGHARASTTPGRADADVSVTGWVTVFGSTQEAARIHAGGDVSWTTARPDLEGGLEAINLTQIRLNGFVVFTANDLEFCSPINLHLDLSYDAGSFLFFLLVPIQIGADVGTGVEVSEMCLGLRLFEPEVRLKARATVFAFGRLFGAVDLLLIRVGVRADLRLFNVGLDGQASADLCKVTGVVDLIFSPVRLVAELFGEVCVPEICICLPFVGCACTPEICTGASLPLIDIGADFHRINLLDQPLVNLDFLPPFVFQVSGGGTYEHEPTVCKRDVTLEARVWDLCDPNPTIAWEEENEIIGDGTPMTSTFGLGDHHVRAIATDTAGNSSTLFSFLGLDATDVKIIDATSPTIDFTLDPTSLWPADNKLYRVATGIGARDVCDATPAVEVQVTSNEPVVGPIVPDWLIVETAPGRWDVWVRAKRLGSGDGRIYTITTTATDDSNNVATVSGNVAVNHDQGH